MKIRRTLVGFEGDSIQQLRRVDTIEHEGKTWLVPYWIDNLDKGTSRPERIVLLDLLEYTDSDGLRGISHTLKTPMPKCVFEGQNPPPSKGVFVIVENPPIEVQTHEILFRDV